MKELLSPNCTKRTDGTKIKKIVLMASLMQDAEAQAKELQNPKRQRSFHYIIGCDGEVIQGVPEDCRAWSAHLRSVDEESISVLFCTKGIPDCVVTDETFDSLSKLISDICERYSITPFIAGRNEGSIILYFVGAYMQKHTQALVYDVNDLNAEKKIKKAKKTRKPKGGTEK